MRPCRHRLMIIAVIVCAVTSSAQVRAANVNLRRIFNEHVITVVTTEKPESITRYTFDLLRRNQNIVTPMELLLSRRNLKDKDSVLFVIDRSKAKRFCAEEEKLMPCPTSALDPTQVIVYAAKASGRNGWEVLVSAPNEKWLRWEMDRLCRSDLDTMRLEAKGSILDRYVVRRVCVVSTEGKQIAADWMAAQSNPHRGMIDWEFCSAYSWDPETYKGMDLVFLLNRAALNDKCTSVVASLPNALQTWHTGEDARREVAVEKEIARNESGQAYTVAAVVAASGRHAKLALKGYPTIDSIPEALTKKTLADLRGCGELLVVARSGDRSAEGKISFVDDLAGKLTSELASGTGFQCISRQDLKELIYTAMQRAGGGNLGQSEIGSIRKKSGAASAVAVVDLAAVTAQTSYVANPAQCASQPYPAFSEPEPSKPSEPSLHKRKYGLFGPKTYSGAEDPRYVAEINNYKTVELPQYERDIKRWEADKREYEWRRASHDMDWIVSLDAIQSAKISGNLRIYDLGSFSIENAGKVIFSCPISGENRRRGGYKSERFVVRGEENQPASLNVPNAEQGVNDQTVISEAIESACEEAVNALLVNALVPIDTAGSEKIQ